MTGEAFVGELIPDVAEEELALGFGVEKRLVLVGREGEVTVNLSAVEAEVQDASWRDVGLSGQELRFQRPPVQIWLFYVIPHRAHDSKIVGTVVLRWPGCHAAASAGDSAGHRFHGSSSAMRLMG